MICRLIENLVALDHEHEHVNSHQRVSIAACPPPFNFLSKNRLQKGKGRGRERREVWETRSGSSCSDKSIKNTILGNSKKKRPKLYPKALWWLLLVESTFCPLRGVNVRPVHSDRLKDGGKMLASDKQPPLNHTSWAIYFREAHKSISAVLHMSMSSIWLKLSTWNPDQLMSSLSRIH